MKSYLKIAYGIDVTPLAIELFSHPELWNKDPERLRRNGPHYESDDIWIRYRDKTEFVNSGDWSDFNTEHDGVWYPAFYELPSCRKLIFDLMARVQGERLGGIFLWRVRPGKRIYPHKDFGWHVDYYDKFNICIQGQEGAAFVFQENNEEIIANTGDVHAFVNTEMHEIINNSNEDYIVLCVCIRTHHKQTSFKRPEASQGE